MMNKHFYIFLWPRKKLRIRKNTTIPNFCSKIPKKGKYVELLIKNEKNVKKFDIFVFDIFS